MHCTDSHIKGRRPQTQTGGRPGGDSQKLSSHHLERLLALVLVSRARCAHCTAAAITMVYPREEATTDLVLIDGLDELITQLEDGEALALLLDGPDVAVAEGGRLAHGLCLPLRRLVPRQANASQLLPASQRLSAC